MALWRYFYCDVIFLELFCGDKSPFCGATGAFCFGFRFNVKVNALKINFL